MTTKVKELTPVNKAKTHDPNCRLCHPPKRGRVYEDQLWGNCPTNAPHPAHAR